MGCVASLCLRLVIYALEMVLGPPCNPRDGERPVLDIGEEGGNGNGGTCRVPGPKRSARLTGLKPAGRSAQRWPFQRARCLWSIALGLTSVPSKLRPTGNLRG